MKGLVWAVGLLLIWALLMYWLNSPAHAHDTNGVFSQLEENQRQWLRTQRIPHGTSNKGGELCCNEADGTYAEEDIINGRYWARWRINDALTAWMPVPESAILDTANWNGSPVVWWFYSNGNPVIRCYAPGPKM
jgi:hypothetical protein